MIEVHSGFFAARLIAQVLKRDKKTVMRRAAREGWPQRRRGNAMEFQPPRGLRAKCLALTRRSGSYGLRDLLIPAARRAEIFRATCRFDALCGLQLAVASGEPIERALIRVARDFTFHASPSSLRLWQRRFARAGFASLLESKLGRSGVDGSARHTQGAAMAQKGR
jgi:hypothetical protein